MSGPRVLDFSVISASIVLKRKFISRRFNEFKWVGSEKHQFDRLPPAANDEIQ
jgi:hypothetical protein